MPRCVWCGEELRFDPKKGYVHEDGNLYKQRIDPKTGKLVDDHCALPRW